MEASFHECRPFLVAGFCSVADTKHAVSGMLVNRFPQIITVLRCKRLVHAVFHDVVIFGTGMRVAECTGITKSDINLSENTISVNHNLIYRVIDGKAGFHITTPKTESGTRIIPILYPEVAEQLRLQIETIDALYPDDQLVLGGVHGFVFRNRTGSFMSAHNINRAIERISVTYNMEEMDQAELEDREPDLLPHFSVHNLRHTFCTRLCESTNDVKFIQQVMGHADFSTTMDIYTHITQENMQEKAKSISVNMKLM